MDIIFFYAHFVALIFALAVSTDAMLGRQVRPYGAYLCQTLFFCAVPVVNLFFLVFILYRLSFYLVCKVKSYSRS